MSGDVEGHFKAPRRFTNLLEHSRLSTKTIDHSRAGIQKIDHPKIAKIWLVKF